ncbi:hypothetical protein [Mycoplasma struthionis]|uniref:Uncharacterized protein n=1 Tax=Mycoplasma struthionis TaxID=538220 RepID=A0A502M2M3_9MOLU|nr:hypothetical protein [Mycoplasma struthionis]TPI02275.1 hypothetical protein FJM01_01245 [Mycoplasma struthionis]
MPEYNQILKDIKDIREQFDLLPMVTTNELFENQADAVKEKSIKDLKASFDKLDTVQRNEYKSDIKLSVGITLAAIATSLFVTLIVLAALTKKDKLKIKKLKAKIITVAVVMSVLILAIALLPFI